MQEKIDPSKAKMHSVMEAANALTSLGENESHGDKSGSDSVTNNDANSKQQRFLPDHKKPDAAPTFPEKLMAMMQFAEQQGDDFCVTWLEDGKSFIIRDPDTFTKQVVGKFFKPTKFSSFTRKLYRWGFRQLNRGIAQDDPVVFGNDFFHRNKPELMAKMKSTTAAATRKQEEMSQTSEVSRLSGNKRPAEVGQIELQQQLLLSQLLRKKGNYGNQGGMGSERSSMYGGHVNHSMPQSSVHYHQSRLSPAMALNTSNHGLSLNTSNHGMSLNSSNHGMSLNSSNHGMSLNSSNHGMSLNNSNHCMSLNNSNHMSLSSMMNAGRSFSAMNGPMSNPSRQEQMMNMKNYNSMMGSSSGHNDSSLLGQFMPLHNRMNNMNNNMNMLGGESNHSTSSHGSYMQGSPQAFQDYPSPSQGASGQSQDYPNAAATAEIVNAAIQALKYA